MVDSNTVALVSAIGTPSGLILVALIQLITSSLSRRAAKRAQDAVELASAAAIAAADHAAVQIAIAEKRQIAETKSQAKMLNQINETTHEVHTIVNSQHTKLLQLVARLTARVAAENPSDLEAQRDAQEAAAGVNKNLQTE